MSEQEKPKVKRKWLLKMKNGDVVISMGYTSEDAEKAKGINHIDVLTAQDISTETQLKLDSKLIFIDRNIPLPQAFGITARRVQQLKVVAETIFEQQGAGAPSYVGVCREEKLKTTAEFLALAFILGELTAKQQ